MYTYYMERAGIIVVTPGLEVVLEGSRAHEVISLPNGVRVVAITDPMDAEIGEIVDNRAVVKSCEGRKGWNISKAWCSEVALGWGGNVMSQEYPIRMPSLELAEQCISQQPKGPQPVRLAWATDSSQPVIAVRFWRKIA